MGSGRNTKLDTDLNIPAPEYIVFRHYMAGPVGRFFAVFIDHIIILLALVAVFIFGLIGVISVDSESLSGVAVFLIFLGFFILNWFYFFLFEWFNRGQTPGKMLLGLRVVSQDGAALDVTQVALRNLLRIADMFPVNFLGVLLVPGYGVAALSAFINGRYFRRLGDLAAGTIVIRDLNRRGEPIDFTGEEGVPEIADQLHMRTVPAPDLTQALNDFAARRRRLHPGRRREIAQAVEEPVRRYFGAEQIDCEGEILLLAAHYYLFRLSGEKNNGSERETAPGYKKETPRNSGSENSREPGQEKAPGGGEGFTR